MGRDNNSNKKVFKLSDLKFMERALSLAARGKGTTSPNPMVGSVLVKGGRVIAEGYHKKPGTSHAERLVLGKAGARAKGAVLYVNLEPCCHYDKRTPPCAQEIIRAGVKRVVVGDLDPNPRVNGKGVGLLKKSGVRVEFGVLSEKEVRLNEIYRKNVRTGLPFIISKAAMSLDGRLTPPERFTGWVTGVPARKDGHKIRSGVDAILVGINTVLRDNPRLTNRSGFNREKTPLRVVLDSRLRIPLQSRVLEKGGAGCLIIGTQKAPASKIRALEKKGAGVWLTAEKKGRVDFSEAIRRMGKMGIRSLLIEGGGEIHRCALDSGLVDKMIWYIAPKISSPLSGTGIFNPGDRAAHSGAPGNIFLERLSLKKIGKDFRVEAYLK